MGVDDFGYVQGLLPITNAGTILGDVLLDEREKTDSSVLVLSNTGFIHGGLIAGYRYSFYFPYRSNTIISVGTIEINSGGTAIQLVGPGYNVTLGGDISGQTAVLMNGYGDQLTVLSGITLNGNIVDNSPGGTLYLGRIAGSLPGVATITNSALVYSDKTAAGTIGQEPDVDGSVSIALDAAWVLDVPDVSEMPIISGFGTGDTLELPGFTATGAVEFPGVGIYLSGTIGGVFLPAAIFGMNSVVIQAGSSGTALEVGSSTLPVAPLPVTNDTSTITGGFYSIGSTVTDSAPLIVTYSGVTITTCGIVTGSVGAAGQNCYSIPIYEAYRGYHSQYVPAGNGAPGTSAVYLRDSVLLNTGTISGGAGGLGGLGIRSYVRYELTGQGGIGVIINSGLLINDGTISGGYGNSNHAYITSSSELTPYDSVSFSGSGTLVVDQGALFNGNVVANSSDVLVLVDPTAAELSEVGTLFRGFGVVDIAGTTAPCFCAGSRIRTPGGDLPVERLHIGDLVETAFAGPQPIKWIGRREYQGRFIANNHLALPVCIKASAIAAGIPSRDLWVSPDHGICEGGVIIHAWRLINGHSIFQPKPLELVRYLHIELDSHQIIFAEDCPTESFLNMDCRERFQNSAEYFSLFGESKTGKPCLPLLQDGYHLENIRTRIAARAGIARAFQPPGPLRGSLDESSRLRLRGWAQDVSTPEIPVELELLLNGQVAGRFLANRYREDLRVAGLGSGCHAFEFSLSPGLMGPVTIRRACDGLTFGGKQIADGQAA
jgi:hypothetical protein